MFKKLVAALGFGNASGGGPVAATGLHSPYAETHVNFLYNLLFCDDPALFRNSSSTGESSVWTRLLADRPDAAELRALATDYENEGRIRALAFNRLRAMGEVVPSKQVLGVIVEVPLANGLDVLAAFCEGGVRYLNQSGKVLVVEGQTHPVTRLVSDLIAASQPVVDKIGPWEEQRLPPPRPGNIRITFLVSDGLYFGEAPAAVLQNDDMAGPVLAKATQLLHRVVELGTSK